MRGENVAGVVGAAGCELRIVEFKRTELVNVQGDPEIQRRLEERGEDCNHHKRIGG